MVYKSVFFRVLKLLYKLFKNCAKILLRTFTMIKELLRIGSAKVYVFKLLIYFVFFIKLNQVNVVVR